MPNPWDIGSAVLLHHIGFKALASTSAGMAFSMGRPDTVTALSRDEVIEHLRLLVTATPLPVNADFQNGYSHDPEQVAENVSLCCRTGVAGISIEDATGDNSSPLYERVFAIERVKAARKAIDQSGTGILLTARCEAYLVGSPDADKIVLDRLTAFAEAGADCLYAPSGTVDPQTVSTIVRAVSPVPVNVLVSRPTTGITVSRLRDLGVRRISVGSALSRLALGAVMQSAKLILETGNFDSLGQAAPFAELNQIFTSR
jgi:2-methylisocitrate lyase-like PEP mutase family enzyme